MNKQTLNALNGSIAKWERIVDCEERDKGVDNCDLCLLFHDGKCVDCPVFIATGENYCYESPHESWCKYCHRTGKQFSGVEYYVFDKKSFELALAELDFLKSLLPEGEG